MSDFVDVTVASELLDLSADGIRKRIQKGMLRAECIENSRGGNGGVSYRISVEALPVEAQLAYYQRTANGDGRTGAELSLDADIVAYRNKYGAEVIT